MSKGEAALEAFADKQDLGFLIYWPESDEARENVSVVLGFGEQSLSSIADGLNSAFHNRETLVLQARGGFSKVEDNQFSHQPTQQQFEEGQVLPFYDFRVTLEHDSD